MRERHHTPELVARSASFRGRRSGRWLHGGRGDRSRGWRHGGTRFRRLRRRGGRSSRGGRPAGGLDARRLVFVGSHQHKPTARQSHPGDAKRGPAERLARGVREKRANALEHWTSGSSEGYGSRSFRAVSRVRGPRGSHPFPPRENLASGDRRVFPELRKVRMRWVRWPPDVRRRPLCDCESSASPPPQAYRCGRGRPAQARW